MIYFSDHEPYAAAWLRNLYPEAVVDERGIEALSGADLDYERVHLFAGIGGWEHALELAGWQGPVWTGSCPCQPFSAAGKRKGHADARDLWPEFRRLIAECQPPVVFGEQVASNLGRTWLAGVRADLETLGYRVGAADLCAAGVGAPHIRQRLYWVADTQRDPGGPGRFADEPQEGVGAQAAGPHAQSGRRSHAGGLADTEHAGRDRAGTLAAIAGSDEPHGRIHRGSAGGVGDADTARSQGRVERRDGAGQRAIGEAGLGFWSDFDLIPCADGKARRIESGTFPLVARLSSDMGSDRPGEASPFRVITDEKGRSIGQAPWRVGMLRGYGNSIVPQTAAAFVRAYMEARALRTLAALREEAEVR